jgi:hypothetical protein
MTSTSSAATSGDDQLVRLLSDVVETFRPLAVYLFGSRAEGRSTATSDYDLVVVLPDDASEDMLDVVKAAASGRRTKVPADIIPTTREVFLACRGNLSTLEGVAQARGKLLYGSL